eukprot:1180211-Prorocentrum_minimum.AAC.5
MDAVEAIRTGIVCARTENRVHHLQKSSSNRYVIGQRLRGYCQRATAGPASPEHIWSFAAVRSAAPAAGPTTPAGRSSRRSWIP